MDTGSAERIKSMFSTATTNGCLLCSCFRLPFATSHGEELQQKILSWSYKGFSMRCRYFWKKTEGGMIGKLLAGLSTDPLTDKPVDDQVYDHIPFPLLGTRLYAHCDLSYLVIPAKNYLHYCDMHQNPSLQILIQCFQNHCITLALNACPLAGSHHLMILLRSVIKLFKLGRLDFSFRL